MRDYEPDVSRIIMLYQQLEDDIIADMIRRIMKMSFVSETTAYQAQVLQTAGILYDDILQMIADRTDASVQQVKALFEDVGVQTVEIDNEVHEEAGETPVDIRQDAGMKQVLEAGYRKTLGTMQNLVSTTASATQQAFIAACDRAYMQVSSGAFSYQQAIRMAVQHLADTGAYITYPSGHRDRIDVAVRRAVLTGVGQTSAAVAQKHAEDAGCTYMELTAHSGARPEHARWQGQLVIIRGERTKRTVDGLKVFTRKEIGYGEGDGFKGWNCRHNWHPYYPGLSTPNYTPDQLKKLDEKSIEWDGKKYTEYEISQMQRTAERKVRALKRRTLAAQTAMQEAPDEDTRLVLETSYMGSATKLKAAERRLKDFCQQTGRRNDTFRTQVQGFGRSEAQRAMRAAKRQHKQTASQTKGSAPTGHTVEVKPPTPKDNGGTGKTYKNEKIPRKSLTSVDDGGIIKSIDVDDFEVAVFGKGIHEDVSSAIVTKMQELEKKGKFYISEVKVDKLYGRNGATPALQIEPLPNGLLRLNVNTDIFSGRTLEEIDERFCNTDSIVANSLEEALIHESGHAKSISRRSVFEIQKMYDELSEIHISGISECAFYDGAECIAETEVLLSRGESVPEKALEIYKKYVLREEE